MKRLNNRNETRRERQFSTIIASDYCGPRINNYPVSGNDGEARFKF